MKCVILIVRNDLISYRNGMPVDHSMPSSRWCRDSCQYLDNRHWTRRQVTFTINQSPTWTTAPHTHCLQCYQGEYI